MSEKKQLVSLGMRVSNYKTTTTLRFLLLLLLVCSLCRCEGCLDEERSALLQIKDSVGYGKRAYPWALWVGDNCCQWIGVWCQDDSASSSHVHVVSLALGSFVAEGLGTWYPNATHFAQFKKLEYLDLSGNQIGGWVMPHGFTQMKSLEELKLQDNRLNESINSLSALCRLRNLKNLHLWFNYLDDGDIPPCLLSNLSSLETLDLSMNNLRSLHGNLSSLETLDLSMNNLRSLHGFSQLKSLKDLDLSNNRLNGSSNSLSALCGLRNLTTFDLGFNNLDDVDIPPCLLANLSSLESLYLYGNNLQSLHGFSQMKSLNYLLLGSNRLNESINSLSGLCGLITLQGLDLSYNSLHDANLPPCLCGLGSIELLHLSDNNLDGQNITQCLSNLSSLRILALQNNNLGDKFGVPRGSLELPNLQTLYLDGNRLTDRNIGSWITNLTSLFTLSLSGNNLKNSGTLMGLCTLRNLIILSLQNNSFEGQIPTCFKEWYSLYTLDLSFNQLSGSIHPSIFRNLTMMASIDVSDNKLNGVIPFSMFANLSKLSTIDLSNNPEAKVEYEYPHWTPTFQLSKLYLTRCNLSGQSIPSFLYSQQHLINFEADYSFLNGTIPRWLLYNVSTPLLLSLRGNMLHGAFPQYSLENSSSMLTKLDISNNNISSTIPSNIGTLFPNMIYFNMSTNALQGSIPPSVGELARLEALDLSNNHLFGKMPLGLTKNNPSLKYLYLSNNSLEGQIFTGDSNISELLILRLDNNLFSGIIPQSLSNSLPLMFLDLRNNRLSGTIPSWFQSLPYLVSILLSGNSFTGKLPPNLCKMQNLHTLDLKNNALSGSIPSCLKNIASLVKKSPIYKDFSRSIVSLNSSFSFTEEIKATTDFNTKGQLYSYAGIPLSFMTGIDLSLNRLTGEIPIELGDLKELHSLNLSNNLLTGSIPPSLMYLTNLESLDLSHNKLNGSIPFELTQMNALSSFSVAFNNLSGEIPSVAQFTTFNGSGFEGNVGLCGALIERKCSSNDPPRPYDKEEDKEESGILDRPLLFYLWVLLSFALGFSSFALVLIFNTNWRQSYFRVADKFINSIIVGIMKFIFYVKR